MIKKRKKSKAEGIIEKRNASTDKVAVIWSRVSSADQFKHNNSIQTQIDACMEYCKRNGIRVKKCDYGARNESAKVSGEKFLEMVTEVQRDPEVNTIVCYDYDRFSRNASEGIMWKTKLKSEGITLNAINQPIPQDNFMAESIENMMIIVANMDNAARKHKCTEGMKACIKRGEWYSRPPLGYDSRKEGKKHIITVNEKGKILRKAFEWKANENLSNEEIVRRLNARGLKMYKQRLSEILRNPFYCGYIEHRYLGEGKRIKGVQEPLISEEMFNKVQENLEGNHDHYEHRDITPEFPLKKTMLCPIDGSTYTGYMVRKKNGQTFPYYKANTKGYPSNVSASTVHLAYSNLLNEYRIPEELHGIMTEVITDKFYEKDGGDKKEMEEIEKQISVLDKKIRSVRMKYALEEIDEPTCRDAVEELEARKAELTREAAGLNEELSNLAEYVSTTVSMSSQLGTWWSQNDFDTCQSIQKLVHPRGIYWDNEKKCYLTGEENEVLNLFRSVSVDYEADKIKNQDKSCDLSCLVDQTLRISNLLEDLRQVFIKSIDAQSSTISQ